MVSFARKKGVPKICHQKISHQIRWVLGSAVGILGVFLSTAMPAKANLLQLADIVKAEPVDKSTIRFEQTRFEQYRRESAQQERQQRLARLREGLLAPYQSVLTQELPAEPERITYLYGQQPIPDQPGTVYFVFESQGTAVIGALYMPSSSFDCVEGRIAQQQIALRGVDSYSQERFSYAMALSGSTSVEVASQQGTAVAAAADTRPNIEGFYPLAVRDRDRELLAICQAI